MGSILSLKLALVKGCGINPPSEEGEEGGTYRLSDCPIWYKNVDDTFDSFNKLNKSDSLKKK